MTTEDEQRDLTDEPEARRLPLLKTVLLGGLPLLFVLAVLYYAGLRCGFVYDEHRYIGHDPLVTGGRVFACARTHFLRGLAKASYAATYAWVGETPLVWRSTQVALHALSTLAVGVVLWLACGARTGPRERRALAWIGMALFALHPLAVEPALYVWARPTVLSTLFSLVSTGCLLAGADAGRSRRRAGYLAGAFLALGLTLVSKEMGLVVSLPVFLLVLRLTYPRVFRAALLVGALGLGLPFLLDQGHVLSQIPARFEPGEFAEHLRVQARGLFLYLQLLVPLPGQYGLSHLVVPAPGWLAVVAASALLAWVLGIALALRARLRLLAVGLGFGLSHVLPYLILPSRAVVEYKAYPLLAGGVLALLGGAEWFVLRSGPRARRGSLIAAALLVAGSLLVSAGQVRAWRSAETLWRQATRAEPDNPECRGYLALALYKAGRLEEATRQLGIAVRDVRGLLDRYGSLNFTNWAWVVQGLGYMHDVQGRVAQAEALYREALVIDPHHRDTLLDLAKLLARQGRRQEAIAICARARSLGGDAYWREKIAQVEAMAGKVGE